MTCLENLRNLKSLRESQFLSTIKNHYGSVILLKCIGFHELVENHKKSFFEKLMKRSKKVRCILRRTNFILPIFPDFKIANCTFNIFWN